MKKQILMASAVLAIAASALAGCGGESSFDPFDAFSDYSVESGVLVKADGEEVRIRWNAEPNAEKYVLSHAESRYGVYERVGEVSSDATEFTSRENVYDYFKVTAIVDGAEKELGANSVFGENALIIGENDDMTAVAGEIESTHAHLETAAEGQFSSRRAAFLFLPGTYDLTAKVGYYTSVSGLGKIPTDVSLAGVYVSDKVLSNRNSTCTFWRSVENVAVRAGVVWSVSQATSFRRAKVQGDLSLSYGGWASGGFLANTVVTGSVHGSSQQQWMTRNTAAKAFDGGSYNMVYAGCEGQIGSDDWSVLSGSVTNLETTEKIAEKPFLYRDGEGYSVFVPSVEENTKGVTWEGGLERENGVSLPLAKFYIANAHYDTSASLNAALKSGRHILFTPGNYTLDDPLEVQRDGTVLFGLGYATLKIGDQNDDSALKIADVGGVRVADLLVDAGLQSENMVVVGSDKSKKDHRDDPTVLSDLYLRIGGVENVHTETDTALCIHSDDVIGDNFWIWRADHSLGVAWDDTADEAGNISFGNPAKTGVEITGDRVRCYGLMVEHFEDYQTLWKGEDGLTVMYQSETPYRVPSQEDWMSHGGEKRGCASYKVDDGVSRHRAIGIGVYLVNYSDVTLDSAIEVPEREGIELSHLITCSFAAGKSASITHVVNDRGAMVGNGAPAARVPKFPF